MVDKAMHQSGLLSQAKFKREIHLSPAKGNMLLCSNQKNINLTVSLNKNNRAKS